MEMEEMSDEEFKEWMAESIDYLSEKEEARLLKEHLKNE